MGFTNVVWESRSTEQLARDLTDGPGPASVGEAGAAWVRVANEFAKVSGEYDKIMERFKASWSSDASSAAVIRLDNFGKWLQAAALSAAGNAQKIEEAAVANTIAIMAMPTVPEAIEAKAHQEIMASLAAYNGAVLNGSFAEFEEAAAADQADAAAVMTRYEDAVADLAEPWDQPLPPQVTNANALRAEKDARGKGGGKGGGGGHGVAKRPPPPMFAAPVKPSQDAKDVKKTAFSRDGGGAGGGMGRGAYGPMGAMGARGAGHEREHESIRPAASLEGGGEAGAGLSESGGSWLPAAQQNDAPFTVSNVSWGPNTAIFDELVTSEPAGPQFAEEPERTLQQVSDRWVSPPVIGGDQEQRV